MPLTLNSPAIQIAVLLLSPAPLLSIAGIDTVLGLANTISDKTLYSLQYYSLDGAAIPLPTGGYYPHLPTLADTKAVDVLLVTSQTPPFANDPRLALLKPLLNDPSLVGAIDCGAWWLAACGLLDHHRATLRWPELRAFAATFPHVICTQNLYEFDRKYFSCGAGAATLDAMLALVARQQNLALAEQIAESLCIEHLRTPDTRQRTSHAVQLGQRQPKLSAVLELMEAHLEDPISSDELARHVDLSRRQLERLFKQHLDTLPARHYMQLRLERARTILQRTGISVVQIGLSCGFSSGAHFATAYRAHFGLSPRDERAAFSKQ
ncbi:GlxA family transcriptional regulator [Iodobacter ciconiae]|uniref:Helix-turn-helix domain-containing protein n=1 Tax=Iodobacter ciconiae TaxID=2496266 RepID=A0A3S8ZPH3_9NEIS|nr:helix-turn-helix domain-containing protein [Iodobacter ciconiae]AZN35377.1 helix-turn-helix domain-containing protein [Iodobacter ciconiae]